MDNQQIKQVLINLFSDYLSKEEIMKLFQNPVKNKAWLCLFKGYSDKEIEILVISIYSHFPTHLPSIQEVKDKCLLSIDKTKYQQEWDFILSLARANQTEFPEKRHNDLQTGLSDEAKYALKDLGGIFGLKELVEPSQLGIKQATFIKDCRRYKEQLNLGLIEPVPIVLREEKATEEPGFCVHASAKGGTLLAFNKAYMKRYNSWVPNPKQVSFEISKAWDAWEPKTEDQIKAFKQHFLLNHPSLNPKAENQQENQQEMEF